MVRKLVVVSVVVVMMLGVSVLALSPGLMAGGKPPCKQCKERVGPCVLISCGDFDCVYQCPFPEP